MRTAAVYHARRHPEQLGEAQVKAGRQADRRSLAGGCDRLVAGFQQPRLARAVREQVHLAIGGQPPAVAVEQDSGVVQAMLAALHKPAATQHHATLPRQLGGRAVERPVQRLRVAV